MCLLQLTLLLLSSLCDILDTISVYPFPIRRSSDLTHALFSRELNRDLIRRFLLKSLPFPDYSFLDQRFFLIPPPSLLNPLRRRRSHPNVNSATFDSVVTQLTPYLSGAPSLLPYLQIPWVNDGGRSIDEEEAVS